MSSSPNSALDASVLVLNKLFMAIHIIPVRRAFCLLCKDLAEVVSLEEMSAADWQNFEATMKPNTDQMRMLGHYAVDTRRRSRRKREQS